MERELDRLLARRFNALDYLRADEHGLSRIVADMLDPRGTHGQGTGFLSELLGLDGVDNAKERLKEPLRRAMQGGAHSRLWPWYRYLEEHQDWGPLMAQLHEESRNAGKLGKLTDYFSRRLVEVGRAAVPIVDEVLASR